MQSSTKDNAEGKMHQAKGKIKVTAGKVVGNRDMEAKGKIENLDGKIQEKLGQIEKVRFFRKKVESLGWASIQ
jgi:uncharacterized protein YjbJ (UPF0337 family)